MFIPTPIQELFCAGMILGGSAIGLRAPKGSSERQRNFAFAGMGAFFLSTILVPNGNWLVDVATIAVGAWSIAVFFRTRDSD